MSDSNIRSAVVKAIVPVAGLGTRLLPATKSMPKEMLPVGRKPVVQYVVEELQAAGVGQVLLVTGRRKQAIEDHFDVDPDLIASLERAGNEDMLRDLGYHDGGTRFFYTRQAEPRGLGDAVLYGAEFAGPEPCVVSLGDSIIQADRSGEALRALIAAHIAVGAAATIMVEEVAADEVYRYGIVAPVEECDCSPGVPFRLRDIVEKPRIGSAPSRMAVAARYVLNPDIFPALRQTPPDSRGELQLTDGIRTLIAWGKPVYAWLLRPGERRYDIGNFESYFRAFVDFALADERYGYTLRKHLKARAYDI
jgi:UTP--glucose-1-phosphate uridylyltransferase